MPHWPVGLLLQVRVQGLMRHRRGGAVGWGRSGSRAAGPKPDQGVIYIVCFADNLASEYARRGCVSATPLPRDVQSIAKCEGVGPGFTHEAGQPEQRRERWDFSIA